MPRRSKARRMSLRAIESFSNRPSCGSQQSCSQCSICGSGRESITAAAISGEWGPGLGNIRRR